MKEIATASEALDAVSRGLHCGETTTHYEHLAGLAAAEGLGVARRVVEQVRERVTDPEPCDCDDQVRAARVEELELMREALRNGSPPLMAHINARLRELTPAPEWDEQWRALGWRPIEELQQLINAREIDDSVLVTVLIRRNGVPHEKASPYALEARYGITPQSAATQISEALAWMCWPVLPTGVDR